MTDGFAPRIGDASANDNEDVQRRLARLRAAFGDMETELRALLRLLDTDSRLAQRSLRETTSRRIDRGADVEYLSIRELATRIPYSEGAIRNLMTRGVFRLGVHYVKPRGRVAFCWSAVRAWLAGESRLAG